MTTMLTADSITPPPHLGTLVELVAQDSRLARAGHPGGNLARAMVALTLGSPIHARKLAKCVYHHLKTFRSRTGIDLMPAYEWAMANDTHRAVTFRLIEWRRKRNDPVPVDHAHTAS